jgi:2-polyprenyl-3-methyl-5-hydroxy-6-metoxy-1,4-benzoquinol methylase
MKGLLLAALLLLPALGAAPPESEQEIWASFVDWLQAQPPSSKPGELIAAYRTDQTRQGVAAAAVNHRMAVISDCIFTRRKGTEVLWNKVYAGAHPIFLETPTALVVSAIENRPPGAALDVGMGQGRNSVYLASRGWTVTGFDPSAEGIRIAQSNAGKAGVKIHAMVSRDDEFDYGTDRWDLIVVTYVKDLTADDARVFSRALKPGGIVVYENGADPTNAVLKAFLGFHIIRFEDLETTADWNPDRRTRVQRLIAEKDEKEDRN